MIFLGAIAMIAAMDFGEGILAPLTLALVTGVVLSPLAEFWEQRGYSAVWGALIGLAATLALIGAFVLAFHPIIAQLVSQAPKVWADMKEVVAGFRGLLRGLSEVTDSVAAAVAPEANAAPAAPATEDGLAFPTVTDALMIAPAILSQVLIFSGALFFFLLTRSEIYDWVSLRLSGRGGRAELAHRLRRADRNVSRYFSTITLINAGLGAITAGVLQAIGVQDAMIWGVVAFIVNFVVYLGPAVFVVTLIFVGVAQFDGAMSLAPAASFLLLNTIEGQFVTPALVGRHMAVNPLLVFLSLIFGLWLWGPIGGIVAIPLLLWVLVLNDAISESAVPVMTPDETA
ncbi:AI-2E family transporter [Defluviimonas sp. WL0050]|uniref:AI-2E family transporter n=1 Tax=Albidovulum litorale TaxID=2984134 RepID=A0ABT2ZPH4_9RHOB|nr:AI-2E family transporter [Defluviimonas sp. WL0050]MCV2872656.1 AI-2E family transporter [Defluviimonas sp. WL0050]